MELNPAQREAVYTLSGPLLVLAGAGSGKTRVVTYRVAELIRRGTRPDRILAVTFTNKAAEEMQQRAAALLGKRLPARPEISTFHSLCVRILRRQIKHLGFPEKFTIYDRSDQESVARTVLREIRVPESTLRPGEFLAIMGRWKSAGLRPEQAAAAAQSDRGELAAAAYRRYQRAMQSAGALDFDDLLLLTEELFDRFPAVLKAEAGRFDHILVDEYQDTNAPQYRIVKALSAGHRNLCVVGDDDQSIYGWRGAEVTHILQFQRDWPDAKIVRLEINYRSTREILDWANRLIAFNKRRYPKQLRATVSGERPRVLQLQDEEQEAQSVANEIAERIARMGRQPGDFAILARTNEQLRSFETALRQRRLPYVLVGGMSFFERKEVRDIVSYLKLLVNPQDEIALRRIINTPARGIGQATLDRLLAVAVEQGKSLWDVLTMAAELPGLPAQAVEGAASLCRLVERYQSRATGKQLAQHIRALIDEIGYADELARQYSDPDQRQGRWRAVEEIVNAAAAYAERHKRPDLAGFLDQLAIESSDEGKNPPTDRQAVTLMTLHAAKGLEFLEVYMVGMEEGILPHKRTLEEYPDSVDEERRLCYVGTTRAQRRLTFTLALARRKWGKPRPTHPSRFLYELTGQADNPNYLKAVKLGPQAACRTPTGRR